MRTKFATILLALFVLSTLVYFSKSAHLSQSTSNFFDPSLEPLIESIQIDYFTQGITLAKNKDQWFASLHQTELAKKIDAHVSNPNLKDNLNPDQVPPAQVNPNLINEALSTLLNLKKETLVSENTEKQGLFEVTSSGLTLTIFFKNLGNKKIIIGKEGPSPFTTYIRPESENKVYLVTGNLNEIFRKTYKEWTSISQTAENKKAP